MFRLLGFAQHLPKFGWGTSVVAPPGLPLEPTDPALVKRIPDEAAVRYVTFPQGWLAKPFRRVMGKAVWLPAALAACVKTVRQQRPAAVLTSGPPHCVHMLGMFLKRVYGLPWVADFRDPWVADEPFGRPRRLVVRGERMVLRGADLILANAPRAAEDFRAAYPNCRDKIVSLTNGFDAGVPAPAAPPTDVVRILHAGEIYTGRDPRPLLDALQSLVATPGRPRFQVCFIGRAAPRSDSGFDLNEEIRKRNLAAVVEVRGQVPYGEALAEMRRANVLLLLDPAGRRAGVPAKLYEYLGSGRPVLALAEREGDTAAVLERSGVLHRVAAPRDVSGIRDSLAALGEAVRAGRPVVADPDALRRFTRESLAGDLAQLLTRLTGSTPADWPGRPTGPPVSDGRPSDGNGRRGEPEMTYGK
jgi:glycosyltransferase involved in cell wall biosynthesis